MVLAGDFNAEPNTPVITALDRIFNRTCAPCAYTIPVINPTKAIDFIAFKPKKKFKIVSHKVLQETYASDHLPIITVFEY